MRARMVIPFLILCCWLVLGRPIASAGCDPNEQCYKCLVSNPFGGCILYGNDPDCEIRKAACQKGVDVPPPPALADPGEQLSACIRDPQHCPEDIIKAHSVAVAQPVFRQYLNDLRSQANGRWRTLPDDFIAEFAADYPEIDLRSVRYANDIDTKHGQSMTLCYEVFLAGSFDDDERSSLEHMLHELYHTVQCVNRGGVGPFVDEYLLHGAVTIVQTGRLDIHDDIDHERDAQQRAVSLINRFGWPVVIENGCPTRVRVLVQILEASGDWVSHGWYEFDGGERSQLVSSSRYLHSRNGIWYLFAEEIDGDREWAGSASIEFEGETYRARMVDDTGESEALGTRLTCR